MNNPIIQTNQHSNNKYCPTPASTLSSPVTIPSPKGEGQGGGCRMSRGLRNNNPLNIIRTNAHWQGMSSIQTDSRFVQFKSLKYGFRAAFRVLMTYIIKYGLKTIKQIISRWAPPNENDTDTYVQTVCDRSGIAKDDIIRFTDREQMVKLASAMAFVENGCIVDEQPIRAGYDLAMG